MNSHEIAIAMSYGTFGAVLATVLGYLFINKKDKAQIANEKENIAITLMRDLVNGQKERIDQMVLQIASLLGENKDLKRRVDECEKRHRHEK